MKEFREELNLGGEWLLALDPDNSGVQNKWFESIPESTAQPVRVPAVWDLWFPDYDGVGWYFRHVHIPDHWLDAHLELSFDAVNYVAEVWLNGLRLGMHEGGYTPFSLDADAAARSGSNLLAVRVIDPKGPDGFEHYLPRELPIAKECGYWSFGGIWGDVRLLRTPRQRIEDVFIQPDLRRSRIAVQVSLNEALPDARIRLRVEDTSYQVESACVPPLLLDMPDFESWHPDSPKVYRLFTELLVDGKVVDTKPTRFGMREFTVKDNRFHLNHRPIFLKGVLYQPDYARSLAAPETEEMARYEITSARDAGFNMIRLHIKPAPPIILDLADELGMLLYEEPSIGWIRKSEYMWDRCAASVREMILRDRNHPSVVIWGMLNETGNAHYVTGGGAQTIKEDLCLLARSLDPTRVIIDDSAGVNATREPSRMMRPWRDVLEEYDDLHIYQRAPVDDLIQRYYNNSGEPDQLCIISEFGFGGPEDLRDVLECYGEDRSQLKDARFLEEMYNACNRGFAERGLDKLFGDFSGFAKAAQELQCDAARLHIVAMRANPKLAGYCYTQLSDAGHEFCAGYLDRWRRPKPVMKTLATVQQPMHPLIQIEKTNLTPREETTVSVYLANDDNAGGMADLSLQVVGPTNQVLWKKKRGVKIPRGRQELWNGIISASGAPGAHRFVVRLMQGMTVLAQASEDFHVFEPVAATDVGVHIVDPGNHYLEQISRLAHLDNVLAPVHLVPRLANTIRAYPDNELMQTLAQVKGGAIALFFCPPDDWNDLAVMLDEGISATSKDGVGGFLSVAHYVKLHPVFEKLPARGLMRQPYQNIVPAKTFLETGDEDICGTFDATPVAAGNYMVGDSTWWGSDILTRRYGSGRIVMTHLRILEHLGKDPVADRLFVNLLNHFGRRSVPPVSPLPPDQKAVEWLRAQRTQQTHRWMVLGEFPNWRGNSGFNTMYPPERVIDFDAVYEGWYREARWLRAYTLQAQGHVLNLQEALEPVFQWYPKFDRSVAYAYAEVTCERRIDAVLRIGIQNATRIWLNNVVVFETERQVPHDQFEEDNTTVTLRQGRNTILVKCAKIPGPFKFALDLVTADQTPQAIKWWK